MKMLSNHVISKSDIDAIDAKQAKQIHVLRVLLAASFVANAALTIALHVLR